MPLNFQLPMVKVPSTAMANIGVFPIVVKQKNFDVVCANDGMKTMIVSNIKLSLLFICQTAVSLSKGQVGSVGPTAP